MAYWIGNKSYEDHDEFVKASRGFDEIADDAEFIEFARKQLGNFQQSGWCIPFEDYYIGEQQFYPFAELTEAEWQRLKDLQQKAREEAKKAYEARKWHYVETAYFADNSVEEKWEDKDGNIEWRMTVCPHGDLC